MKTVHNFLVLTLLLAAVATGLSQPSQPMSQIGAKAGADYKGDGLTVVPTAEGARLRCLFQRLEGEATREGLWLTSTITNAVNDRFRVVAAAVGRNVERGASERQSVESSLHAPRSYAPRLPDTGTVSIDGQTVRFARPGLAEEYSVSMDGVRQDFVVLERPALLRGRYGGQAGAGQLAVRLAVSGAKVEPAAFGAQLVLENSGRKIAYSRLRVSDATGKELNARMEVLSAGNEVTSGVRPSSGAAGCDSSAGVDCSGASVAPEVAAPEDGRTPMLVVLVNDADAVYPVRIDPTFSDANWISMGGIPGANDQVYAAVVDGLGNLYIGGYFTIVGDVIANGVAKWNGSSWSALGSGTDGNVFALAVSGSDLYAGGYFTMAGGGAANNIAKWNGSSWTALASGMNSTVRALAVSGSDVYAGGEFKVADGSPANSIAKWNGSSWTALGSGMNSTVSALAVSGSDLYAGGYFTTAGGSAANRVAKWDGSSWAALGSAIGAPPGYPYYGGNVQALAVSGSELYAGGYFTTAGGSAAGNIAKWDGSSWVALGSGMGGGYAPFVSALAMLGGGLYAGGSFTTAGGSPATGIAKWNGSSWTALGLGGCVHALAVVSSSDLYAGGNFVYAGGSPANYIAKWDGSNWSALGSGLSAFPDESFNDVSVSALAVSGSDVYVAGYFTNAGGSAANNVAKWNGTNWTALGSGVNAPPGDPYYGVLALAVSGSNLYAGGAFTTAGGSAANYIAKWNGSNWSALGSGMGRADGLAPFVNALAVSGSDVYAGGLFTTAGGSPANLIAKWNGSSWTALGSGMDGDYVSALAVSGSDVYAGGLFTTAGGREALNIAKWNGSTWTALGSGTAGLSQIVYALAVSGSNIYAGGNFTIAGGSAANHIAKWNGSSWSSLGSGMNYGVSALAVSGGDLYAGGVFTTAGGSVASAIAKWNGSSWTALGSGIGGNVFALALSGSELYAGGRFLTAGGKVSAFLARAIVYPPVLALEGDGDGGYFIRFSGVPGSAYRLQRAPGVSGPWTASGPQTAPASGFVEFWDLFPPPGQAFYRTVQP